MSIGGVKGSGEFRGWKALEDAIAREDLPALHAYLQAADRADPRILSNPLDAQARHCYFRLSAESQRKKATSSPSQHRRWPPSSWPQEQEGEATGVGREIGVTSRPSVGPVRLSGPMGMMASGGLRRDFAPTLTSAPVNIRAAVAQVLSPPPAAALGAGSGTLAAREAEEREDIVEMELYELAIIRHFAADSAAAVTRRELHRQLVQLEMSEASARMNVASAFDASARHIQAFLRQWRRGPAMEQNNFLISELLTRNRIEGEEDKARGAIVAELLYIEERVSDDWSRLQRLQRELSKASLLHRRVAIMGAVGTDCGELLTPSVPPRAVLKTQPCDVQ
jgi:hypothetical protein